MQSQVEALENADKEMVEEAASHIKEYDSIVRSLEEVESDTKDEVALLDTEKPDGYEMTELRDVPSKDSEVDDRL